MPYCIEPDGRRELRRAHTACLKLARLSRLRADARAEAGAPASPFQLGTAAAMLDRAGAHRRALTILTHRGR